MINIFREKNYYFLFHEKKIIIFFREIENYNVDRSYLFKAYFLPIHFTDTLPSAVVESNSLFQLKKKS